jgi:mycothiol system anti-sigma-R factor
MGSEHSEADHIEPPAHAGRRSPAETGECQEALETLYYYLDGELTEERRRRIQHHLEACSPCLEAFDFEAELKMVIARHCRDRVPDRLRYRVVMALREASADDFPSP